LVRTPPKTYAYENLVLHKARKSAKTNLDVFIKDLEVDEAKIKRSV
jgi:hypothetical protein